MLYGQVLSVSSCPSAAVHAAERSQLPVALAGNRQLLPTCHVQRFETALWRVVLQLLLNALKCWKVISTQIIPNAYMFPCEGRTCTMLSSVGVRSLFMSPPLFQALSQFIFVSSQVSVQTMKRNFRGLAAALWMWAQVDEELPRLLLSSFNRVRSSWSDVVALVRWISLSSFKNKSGVCGCLKCVEPSGRHKIARLFSTRLLWPLFSLDFCCFIETSDSR